VHAATIRQVVALLTFLATMLLGAQVASYELGVVTVVPRGLSAGEATRRMAFDAMPAFFPRDPPVIYGESQRAKAEASFEEAAQQRAQDEFLAQLVHPGGKGGGVERRAFPWGGKSGGCQGSAAAGVRTAGDATTSVNSTQDEYDVFQEVLLAAEASSSAGVSDGCVAIRTAGPRSLDERDDLMKHLPQPEPQEASALQSQPEQLSIYHGSQTLEATYAATAAAQAVRFTTQQDRYWGPSDYDSDGASSGEDDDFAPTERSHVSTQSASDGAAKALGVWICTNCTLQNVAAAVVCNACDGPQAAAKTEAPIAHAEIESPLVSASAAGSAIAIAAATAAGLETQAERLARGRSLRLAALARRGVPGA